MKGHHAVNQPNFAMSRRTQKFGWGAIAVFLAALMTLLPSLALAEEGRTEEGVAPDRSLAPRSSVDPTREGVSKFNGLRFDSDDGRIRYAGIQNIADFNKTDGTDALLSLSYWYSLNLMTGGGRSYGQNPAIPESGKFFLRFQDQPFYSKIARIDVTDDADSAVWASMTKEDENGMEWSAPINKVSYVGSIGTEFQSHIHVYLKDGVELKDIPSPDDGFRVESYYVRFDGTITPSTIGNTAISYKKPPSMPSETTDQVSHWYSNGLSSSVVYDQASSTVYHTFTFKPTENYLQSGYNWAPVFYDQLDPEMVPFLERATIYNSDRQGAPTGSGSAKAFALNWDDKGLVTSKENKDISWQAADSGSFSASRFREVRNNVNDIYWGVLGQSRSYTMAYKLKDEAITDISEVMARKLDLALPEDQRLDFRSWVECDLVDSFVFGVLGKSDGGAPPKLMEYSYAHNFLNLEDADKDGLTDYYEQSIGTDPLNNDTDGDGVPDGVEVLIDKTDPRAAGSWTPGKPETSITTIRAGQVDVSGTVPKPLHKDSLKPGSNLRVDSEGVAPLKVYLVEVEAVSVDPASGKPKLDVEAAERSGRILGVAELASKAEVEAGKFAMKLAGAAKDSVEYRLVAVTPKGEATLGSKLTGSSIPMEKTAPPVFLPVAAGDARISLTAPTGAHVVVRLPSGIEVDAVENTASPGTFVAPVPTGTVLKAGDDLSAVASKMGESPSDRATTVTAPGPTDADSHDPAGRPVSVPVGAPALPQMGDELLSLVGVGVGLVGMAALGFALLALYKRRNIK